MVQRILTSEKFLKWNSSEISGAQKTTKWEKESNNNEKKQQESFIMIIIMNYILKFIKQNEIWRDAAAGERSLSLSSSLYFCLGLSAWRTFLHLSPSLSLSVSLPLLLLVCLGSSSCLALDNRRLLFKCAASCDSSCVTGANNISKHESYSQVCSTALYPQLTFTFFIAYSRERWT